MNKTQLVDALAARIGDKHTAASAIDGLLDTIVDTVRSGGSVSITGFGVFESRARAARTARNPRTGEAVDVPATTVPAFRPGTGFRTAVGGGGAPGPRSGAGRRTRASTAQAAATEPVVEAPVSEVEAEGKGSSKHAGGGSGGGGKTKKSKAAAKETKSSKGKGKGKKAKK